MAHRKLFIGLMILLRSMRRKVWSYILVVMLALSLPLAGGSDKKSSNIFFNPVEFFEYLNITTQQDFKNGTWDSTVDLDTYPGNITLKKYTSNYTVGKLDAPSSSYSSGYTVVPGDSAFIFSSPGTVKRIAINVGTYAGSFKVKVLRRTNTGLWYAVATSPVLYPSPNQLNYFNVNLNVSTGDRLGIYTVSGQLSALSANTDTGYWYYTGEVGSTPVTMNWDFNPAFITMQAEVESERYYSEGNWTSQIIEFKTVPENISVGWFASIPPGAGMVVYARTSPDGISWTPWEIISNNSSPSVIERFMQLKVTLTSDGAHVPILHEISIRYRYKISLTINEFSSFGSNEWIEIKNSGNHTLDLGGIEITDFDSLHAILPSIKLNAGDYYVLNLSGDYLRDSGDDIGIIYRNKTLDYVSYASSAMNEIDGPPPNVTFILNGRGFGGHIPAPGNGESVSLIPDGYDCDRASDWYITPYRYSTPGSRNVYGVFVSSEDISPRNVHPGENATILHLILQTDSSENLNVSSMVIMVSGTLNTSEISEVYVYMDADFSSNVSMGDKYLGGGTINWNTTYINLNITLNSSANVSLIVGAVFSTNATPDKFVQFSISDIYVESAMAIFESSPSTGRIYIAYPDNTPPSVVNVSFSSQQPFGVGVYDVAVEFNEPMNTSVQPVVMYGPPIIKYYSTGQWINSTLWVGKIEIYNNSPSGNYVLSIEGAKDIAGNEMSDYSTTFYVDTDSPYVTEIYLGGEPVGPGEHVVYVNFSEDMDTSHNLEVICIYADIQKRIIGNWKTSLTWEGTLVVEKENLQSNATLIVKGGMDKANNSMYIYEYSFRVDTLPPSIVDTVWSMYPPLKNDTVCNITVKFSEEIKNFSVVVGGREIYATKVSDDTYIITLNTNDFAEGEYRIKILNLTDMAGNSVTTYLEQKLIIDKTPPEINVVSPETVVEGRDMEIYVYANDTYGISYVMLIYEIGGRNYTVYLNYSGGIYRATIPGNIVGGDVKYRVYAVDLAGNVAIKEGKIKRIPSWSAYWIIWVIFGLFYSLPFIFEFVIRRGRR